MTQTAAKPLKPFLKYCGSKTWLASRLAEMYEPFRNTHTWVEPFCGALGATLGVVPERAILSDINPHLIALYKSVANGMKNEQWWENSKEQFEEIKSHFNSQNVPNNPALFYYLNRTCFNGLCRFNLKGEFNVGYGNYKKPKLDHDFSLYQEAFKGWTFLNFDYIEMLSSFFSPRAKFIYADPPYDDGFTSYSGSFTWNDQVSLATKLASLNCPVVASNKATDRIVDLYQGLGFDIEFIDVRRRIACNGDRTSAKEILATRNLCQNQTH